MEIQYDYYTDENGEIRYYRPGVLFDEKTAEIGCFIKFDLNNLKRYSSIQIPEWAGSKRVSLVMIYTEPSGNDSAQIPPLPLIKKLYIPSGVCRILIQTAAATTDFLAETTVERFNPLEGCEVEISPDNPWLCVHENGIYSKDMTVLFYILSTGEGFEVPEGVKRIKSGAGSSLSELRRLTIPESVVEIEDGAFEYCSGLEYADIHAEKLGNFAFRACTSMTRVRVDCKELGKGTFYGCVFLEAVELMNTEEIGDAAFSCCNSLSEIKLSDAEPDFRVFENGLYNKDMTELLCILPGTECYEAPSGVTRIKSGTGKGLVNLRRLILHEGVTDIGNGAFEDCRNLEHVEMYTESIGERMFYKCKELRSVRLGCKKIGKQAFDHCTHLETVELFGTEEIDKLAFSNCKSLKRLRLSDALCRIDDNAFSSAKTKELILPPEISVKGKEITDHPAIMGLEPEVLEVYLKDGLLPFSRGVSPVKPRTTIIVRSPETEEILFKFVVLQKTGKAFTDNGFDLTAYDNLFMKHYPIKNMDTRDMTLFAAAYARFNYPYKISERAKSFFDNYVSVFSAQIIMNMINSFTYADAIVSFPSLDLIGKRELSELIEYAEVQRKPEVRAVLLQRLFERENEAFASYIVWISPSAKAEDLSITVPEEIDGRPVGCVTIISEPSASPMSGDMKLPLLKYLYLPSSVRYFYAAVSEKDNNKLFNMKNRRSPLNDCKVEISPDNPYLCVHENGIYSKDMKTLHYIFSPGESFEVPKGVRTTGYGAGEALRGLKRLVIPKSVKRIEDCAFYGCRELEEAEINTKKLGALAFNGCEKLASVKLTGCTEIGDNAFDFCPSLKEIHLPDTLRLIGNHAFRSSGITHLIIPRSVREIRQDIIHNIKPKYPMKMPMGRTLLSILNRNNFIETELEGAVLEIYLNEGTLPVKPGVQPAEDGTLIIVRSPETGEKLFEFAILGSVDNVFTAHGIDFTEYDNIFRKPPLLTMEISPQAKYIAARTRLRCPYKIDREMPELYKKYVSDETEKIIMKIINGDSGYEGDAVSKEDTDLINDKGLMRLIEGAARAGKPEIATVLMEYMRERKSNGR